MWQHPLDREFRVPLRVATAIAVMEMGITEYSVIAEASGLSETEVQHVDDAEEPSVLRLCVEGIPRGTYFRIESKVRCPGCHALTAIAPCMTCCQSP